MTDHLVHPVIPDEFICPITLDIMRDPVLCDDGHVYDKHAIRGIKNNLSPLTRQPIDLNNLKPCDELKKSIDEYVEKNEIILEPRPLDDKTYYIVKLHKLDMTGLKIVGTYTNLLEAKEIAKQLELASPGSANCKTIRISRSRTWNNIFHNGTW
jgi:hypothetical protein